MPCTGGTFTLKLETYNNQISGFNQNNWNPIQRYFTPISSSTYSITSTAQQFTLIASIPINALGLTTTSFGFAGNTTTRLLLGTVDLYYTSTTLGGCKEAEYIRVAGGKYQKISLCDSGTPGKIKLFANWVPNTATLFDPDVNNMNLWYGANGASRDPFNGASPVINAWDVTAVGNASYSETKGLIQTGPISSADPLVGSRAFPFVIPSYGLYGQYLLSQGKQPGVPFTMTTYVTTGWFYIPITANYVLDYCSLEPITNDYTMIPFNPAGGNGLVYPFGQSRELSLDCGKSRKNLMTIKYSKNITVNPWQPRTIDYAASLLIDTTCEACV